MISIVMVTWRIQSCSRVIVECFQQRHKLIPYPLYRSRELQRVGRCLQADHITKTFCTIQVNNAELVKLTNIIMYNTLPHTYSVAHWSAPVQTSISTCTVFNSSRGCKHDTRQKHVTNRDSSSLGHLYGLRNREMLMSITRGSYRLYDGCIWLQRVESVYRILIHTSTLS